VEIGNLLVGGFGRDDVDELVLSVRAHVSPYGLSGPPSLDSAELRRDRLLLSYQPPATSLQHVLLEAESWTPAAIS
jgi:hypothetical protein